MDWKIALLAFGETIKILGILAACFFGAKLLIDYYVAKITVTNRAFAIDPDMPTEKKRAAFIEAQVTLGVSPERAIAYADDQGL
jgi:hypothetical protein